ncbi:unnamed protein product [Amoebophrya sp. A25]|nr:unnamed protein product [Amoebophrya sp. A25]|eukprot:GSA25T00016537001.1
MLSISGGEELTAEELELLTAFKTSLAVGGGSTSESDISKEDGDVDPGTTSSKDERVKAEAEGQSEDDRQDSSTATASKSDFIFDEESGTFPMPTDQMLIRFLQARNFDHEKTELMLRKSLRWRSKLGEINHENTDFSPSFRTQSWTCLGTSTNGEPILFVRAGRWNPQDYSVQQYERYLEYYITAVGRMADVAASKTHPFCRGFLILFDLRDWAVWHAKYFKHIGALVHVTQDHHPQRLGKAYLINAPKLFGVAWKVISPWLNERTRAKVTFLNDFSLAGGGSDWSLEALERALAQEQTGGASSASAATNAKSIITGGSPARISEDKKEESFSPTSRVVLDEGDQTETKKGVDAIATDATEGGTTAPDATAAAVPPLDSTEENENVEVERSATADSAITIVSATSAASHASSTKKGAFGGLFSKVKRGTSTEVEVEKQEKKAANIAGIISEVQKARARLRSAVQNASVAEDKTQDSPGKLLQDGSEVHGMPCKNVAQARAVRGAWKELAKSLSPEAELLLDVPFPLLPPSFGGPCKSVPIPNITGEPDVADAADLSQDSL